MMAKPHEIAHKFAQLAPNTDLLDKLWHKYPSEYIRTRLRAIRLLWQGTSRQDVIETLHIGHSTILRWMRLLVEYGVDSGLRRLATPKKAPKSGKLSYERQAALIEIIEQKKPSDYGFEQHLFTGAILVKIVEQEWGMTVSDQTIYNILQRNRFSYQRGHRDYEPADPSEQHAYGERVKKSSKHPKQAKKSSSLTNSGLPTDQPSSMGGHA
jgi:transposase